MGRKRKKASAKSAGYKARPSSQEGADKHRPVLSGKVSARDILPYAGALFGMVFLFFFLHYLSNQIPYDLAKQRFASAFEGSSLTLSDYVRSGAYAEKRSVLLHMGGDQFSECQMLGGVLVSAAGSAWLDGKNTTPLGKAILPWGNYPLYPRDGYGYCSALHAMVTDADNKPTIRTLKFRYWWGNKAIYGLLLRGFSVFDVREVAKSATYLSWILLALFLFAYSPRVFAVISPVVIFGVLFSGAQLFANISDALPFLWCVIAASGLTLLMRYSPSPRALGLFSFIAGCVSSYVWWYDGHTVFVISMFALIVYFGSRICLGLNQTESLGRIWSAVWRYMAGAGLSMAAGQVVKSLYFLSLGQADGARKLFAELFGKVESLKDRTFAREDFFAHPYVEEYKDLAFFDNAWLAQAVAYSTIAALVFALALILKNVFSTQRFTALIDIAPFVVSLFVVYARMWPVQDQPDMYARYLFILFALAWCALVVAFLYWRKGGLRAPSPA